MCEVITFIPGKVDGHIMLYCSVLLIQLPDSCPAAGSVTCLFCGRDGLEMFSFICCFNLKIGYLCEMLSRVLETSTYPLHPYLPQISLFLG